MSLAPILKRVATDSSLTLILRIVGLLLSYCLSLVLARLYGAGEMGAYFLAINLLSILSVVCCLGLDIGLLRFTAALQAKGALGTLPGIFWPACGLVVLLGLLAGLGMYAGQGWLGRWFHSPSLESILVFAALALPLLLLYRLCSETVRALGGIRWLSLEENLLSPALFLVLIITLALYSPGLMTKIRVLGLALFSKILFAITFLAVCLKLLWPSAPTKTAAASFRDLLSYGWPIYLTALIGLTYVYLDSLFLGLFTSPEDVAYYGVATKLAPLVSFPLVAVNAVIPPLFASLFEQGNLRDLQMLAQTTARWMYYFALPAATILILLAPELLGLFGRDFLKARVPLTILAMAHLINVATGSVGIILQMTGHQKEMMRLRLLVGLGSLILMPVLAAALGINGISIANALSLISINVLMGWSVWKCLQIKAFVLGAKWAYGGVLLGGAFFLAVKPVLGVAGATAIFVLGYLSCTARPLKYEFGLLRIRRVGE